MSNLEIQIIGGGVVCLIAIIFNLYILRHPDVVDKPLEGWWGKTVGATQEGKEDRLEAYRRQARRNFWIIALILLFLLRNIYLWLTS